MARRRIAQHEISLGSGLAWDVYDGDGRLLLRRGHVVVSHNQIAGLIERGLYVESDPFQERQSVEVVANAEEPSAIDLILEARRRLDRLLAQHSVERFPEHVLRIAELIRKACQLAPHASLASIVLDREGRYSARHCVDVAVVCQVVGVAFELDQAKLTGAIAGALTMNLGMQALQDILHSYGGPLTAQQRETIRKHPVTSAEALSTMGVNDEVWLQTVLDHHEVIDGSGYPAAKKGNEIHFPARLVSLADVYCALISGRGYRPPMHPTSVLRQIFLGQGLVVDQGLAARLIKTLGVYPPGTAVRLENGEIGVVTHPSNEPGAPHVCSLIGPRGSPLVTPVPRKTSLAAYAIRESVDWSQLGATGNLQTLWGKEGVLD